MTAEKTEKREPEQKETRVMVAKADLPLLVNETVQHFERALREALKAKFNKKYKLDKNGYLWVCDVYADRAIVDIEPGYLPGKKRPMTMYLQVSYQRGPNGFEFGAAIEVVRQVIYVPKTAKSDVQKDGKSLWEGVV